MTADHFPSGANPERPLRPASLIASGACVIYWLSLTFGLLQPHAGNFQVYAVATELAQAWIPGRTADVLDGSANLLGLAVGMAVLRAGSGVADALSTPSGPSRW